MMHDGYICSIETMGHAEYADYGNDVVCAGVSCIMFGTYNALDELSIDGIEYELDDSGYFKISTSKTDIVTQTVLRTGLISLETLHDKYAKFIKIRKSEV